MDYSRYPLNNRFYSGSERKVGLTIKGENYILKFQKLTAFGMRFNHISEYLGSHFFEQLGIPFKKHIWLLSCVNKLLPAQDFMRVMSSMFLLMT